MLKLLATPAFLSTAESHNFFWFSVVAQLPDTGHPDMLVGDPLAKEKRTEDGGRTVRLHSPFKFYAIRTDDEENGSYITCMLCSEY